jgi:RNA polymerase sigma-70 factor (ECF subfamily)
MLRSRKSRREETDGAACSGTCPRMMRMGAMPRWRLRRRALLVVLETLAPAERLAFVLHDMFAVPFEEIARSSAARLLRRGNWPAAPAGRVQGRRRRDADFGRQKSIVDAFLKASRDGDFEGLLAVLDPEWWCAPIRRAQRLGSLAEIRGASALPSSSRAARRPPNRRWSTDRWRSPLSSAVNCASWCA